MLEHDLAVALVMLIEHDGQAGCCRGSTQRLLYLFKIQWRERLGARGQTREPPRAYLRRRGRQDRGDQPAHYRAEAARTAAPT